VETRWEANGKSRASHRDHKPQDTIMDLDLTASAFRKTSSTVSMTASPRRQLRCHGPRSALRPIASLVPVFLNHPELGPTGFGGFSIRGGVTRT